VPPVVPSALGVGWRPVVAALDSGHKNAVGKAVGGVHVGVVVTTGAGSQPPVARDASGQRVAPSGAFGGGVATCGVAATGWDQVNAHVIGASTHLAVDVGTLLVVVVLLLLTLLLLVLRLVGDLLLVLVDRGLQHVVLLLAILLHVVPLLC
jgi:hypothetical protein